LGDSIRRSRVPRATRLRSFLGVSWIPFLPTFEVLFPCLRSAIMRTGPLQGSLFLFRTSQDTWCLHDLTGAGCRGTSLRSHDSRFNHFAAKCTISRATSNVAPFTCFVCNRKINQLEVITIFQIDIRQSCFYYRYLGLRIILSSIFLSSTSQEVTSPNVYDSPQEIRTLEHGILSFD